MPSPRGERGRRAERLAEALLREAGYRVVASNVRTPRGEIDLVAWDGPVLCFVEVKARGSDAFGSPEEAVTPAKRSHLRSAARAYLADLGKEPDSCRFDVVAIDLDPDDRIVAHRVLKDAFT